MTARNFGLDASLALVAEHADEILGIIKRAFEYLSVVTGDNPCAWICNP